MNTLKAYLTETPVITNRDAENMGIGRHTLSALANQGKLERIRPGVYQKTGEIVDDFILISSNSKRIVFRIKRHYISTTYPTAHRIFFIYPCHKAITQAILKKDMKIYKFGM